MNRVRLKKRCELPVGHPERVENRVVPGKKDRIWIPFREIARLRALDANNRRNPHNGHKKVSAESRIAGGIR